MAFLTPFIESPILSTAERTVTIVGTRQVLGGADLAEPDRHRDPGTRKQHCAAAPGRHRR
jgi:hypothetical protein